MSIYANYGPFSFLVSAITTSAASGSKLPLKGFLRTSVHPRRDSATRMAIPMQNFSRHECRSTATAMLSSCEPS